MSHVANSRLNVAKYLKIRLLNNTKVKIFHSIQTLKHQNRVKKLDYLLQTENRETEQGN